MADGARPRVGVIGLGVMGEAMALNIARGGLPLSVFDVRPEPMQRLAAAGAIASVSVADLARESDLIAVVVVDARQAAEVVLGSPDVPGVVDAAKPDTTVLIHSTIGVTACRELADQLVPYGIRLVDAPITGAPAGAKSGALTIMAGGDPDVIDACRPALNLVARKVVRVGDVGAGQLVKLANNLVFANTLQGVHEALVLAAAVGLQDQVVLDVLSSGSAQSWIVDNWAVIGESARTYQGGPDGVAALTYKDLALAMSVAHDAGLSLPMTALAAQLLVDAYRHTAFGAAPQRT